MRFGPMWVEVRYVISGAPTRDHEEDLRMAAEELTDDRASVEVEHGPAESGHELITRFTVPRTAQYKVVDEIAHRFKMTFGCFHDYADLSIYFPSSRPRRRSRSKSSSSR